MDYTKLATFLLDPTRTTPLFRKRLRAWPNATLRNSGLHPGEIANLVGAVSHTTEQQHTNELEEFDLVFNKITYTNVMKSKSAQDDWTTQT